MQQLETLNYAVKKQNNGEIHIWRYNTGARKKIMKAKISMLDDKRVRCDMGNESIGYRTGILPDKETAERELQAYFQRTSWGHPITFNHKPQLTLKF